jgi:hypothetical protein
MRVPLNHIYATKSVQDCNYLQGLEGECDSSHLSFLHRTFTETKRGGGDPDMYALDASPKLEGVETDYGVRMISRRHGGAGMTYLRVSNFVMPCHGFVPTGGLKGNPEGYTIHSHVPIDDEHSLRFNILFRRRRPVQEEEKRLEEEIGPGHRKVRNLQNNYLQDREEQKHETFIGIGKSFPIHDSCATESMGPISDRSRERLGKGDITVIAVRKFLLQAAKDLESGKEPPHQIRTEEENDCSHIMCIVDKIDSRTDPKEYLKSLAARQTNGIAVA